MELKCHHSGKQVRRYRERGRDCHGSGIDSRDAVAHWMIIQSSPVKLDLTTCTYDGGAMQVLEANGTFRTSIPFDYARFGVHFRRDVRDSGRNIFVSDYGVQFIRSVDIITPTHPYIHNQELFLR